MADDTERAREGQPVEARAAAGRRIAFAELGERFVDVAFSAATIAGQVDRLVPQKNMVLTEQRKIGPLQVSVRSEAHVLAAVAERRPDFVFDVVVPVDVRIDVKGSLGLVKFTESYEAKTRVSFRLSLQVFDTLLFYLDATAVHPDGIAVALRSDGATGFAQTEVERGLRQTLADQFNMSITSDASVRARSIDLLAQVQRYLAEAPSAG